MAKKAGIFVGFVIIALAISLWVIFGGEESKTTAGGGKSSSASSVSQSEKPVANNEKPLVEQQVTPDTSKQDTTSKTTNTQPVPTPSNDTTTAQVNPPAEKKAKQEFLKIDDSDMGQSVVSRSEVMVVAKKEVIVLDGDVGTKNAKQLSYSVQLLSGSDRFSLFLNGNVYKTLKVGEKLKVDYDVYRNAKGVDFPVVMNATVVK